MALKHLFKLEKLKITAYKKRSRAKADEVGSFEAMFNPTSFKQKHEIEYTKGQAQNSTGKEVKYTRSKPSSLDLTLVLDGTGVDQIGLLKLVPQKSVYDRVKEFIKLTHTMDGSTHQPNFLVVEWGDLIFSCRLSSVEVNYTSFDRDGTALRAELTVKLYADVEDVKRLKKERKGSPDLTHSRVVRNGDTLPLLTEEIYGSAAHYLLVAEFNRLDDFRNLTPGQEIFFPPLES